MGEKVWLARPKFFGLEKKYLEEAISSNWISTVGGQLDTFKSELKSFLSYSGGISLLNSGTSALHMALVAAGVEKGDRVLCSTLTFVASANVIKYLDAIPVFLDSERESWNLCPELLKEALEDLKQKNQLPKALILVHLCGIPAKVNEISAICNLYGVRLIEDAAGAFGSKVQNQYVGTFGDFGVFSLNGNKIITGGSGGILLSKDSKSTDRIDFLSSQAKSRVNPYEHEEIGFNYGMDNLSVAVARAQLQHFGQILEEKTRIAETYKNELKHLEFAKIPVDSSQNHWLTAVLFPDSNIKQEVFNALENEKIESRFIWKPMHQQEIYANCKVYDKGVSDYLFSCGLCLPSDINMSEQDLQRIIKIIQVN